MNIQAFIDTYEPCEGAQEYLATQSDLRTAWANCERLDWLIWTVARFPKLHNKLRLFSCAVVRQTPLGDGRTMWDLLTDERSRNAVEVAERYARGEATLEELETAAADARASARASAYAADADARASARASAYAADASARASARASAYAADASARASAYAAADADAAAREFQMSLFRETFTFDEIETLMKVEA